MAEGFSGPTVPELPRRGEGIRKIGAFVARKFGYPVKPTIEGGRLLEKDEIPEVAERRLTPEQQVRLDNFAQEAERIVQIKDFDKRNEAYARLVARQAVNSLYHTHSPDKEIRGKESLLEQASEALENTLNGKREESSEGIDPRLPKDSKVVEEVFYNAALEAGKKFKEAFDPETGEYRGVKSLIGTAADAATEVNQKYLPKLGKLLGSRFKNAFDAETVNRRAGFIDDVIVYGKVTGLPVPKEYLDEQHEAIRNRIKHTIKKNDNYSKEHIDNMKMSSGFMEVPEEAYGDEHFLHELTLRLANATFSAGQIHRARVGQEAKEQGKETDATKSELNRINPEKKINFGPFDVMAIRKYREALGIQPEEVDVEHPDLRELERNKLGADNAFYRGAFELEKDAQETREKRGPGFMSGETVAQQYIEQYVDRTINSFIDEPVSEVTEEVINTYTEKVYDQFTEDLPQMLEMLTAEEKFYINQEHKVEEWKSDIKMLQLQKDLELKKEGTTNPEAAESSEARRTLAALINKLDELEKSINDTRGDRLKKGREKARLQNALEVLQNEAWRREVAIPVIQKAVIYRLDQLRKEKFKDF